MRQTLRGFTLIELLVVIAIIGLLSAVVLAALTTARNNGADGRRVADLHAVQQALQLYANNNNGQYPSTSGAWYTQCASAGYTVGVTQQGSASAVIPNLISDGDIKNIPSDPQMDATNGKCCYMYKSNGTDYKFLVGFGCPTANYWNGNLKSLVDPARNSNTGFPTAGNYSSGWAAYTSIGSSPTCTSGPGVALTGGACY